MLLQTALFALIATTSVTATPFDANVQAESGDFLPLDTTDVQVISGLANEANLSIATILNMTGDETREAKWDQLRFMRCADYGGHVVGYYDHSPGAMEAPTQLAFRKRFTPDWAEGCMGHMKALTDDAEWGCNIKRYGSFDKTAKGSFMGTTTYGFHGFNCFMDDGHIAHRDENYGDCYTEMYCNHERALSIELGASKETASIIYRSTVAQGKPPNLPSEDAKGLVKRYLSQVKDLIGGQQCKLDPISIDATGCKLAVDCWGDIAYVAKLNTTLLKILDSDAKDMFKPIYTEECTPQPPICDPEGGHCKYLPDICDYRKGVEMPSQYALSAISKVTPNADPGDESPLLATMKVAITCPAPGSNGVFCSAMNWATSALSLAPVVGPIFGVGRLTVTAVCS